MIAAGLLAVLLLVIFFGGYSRTGAHTNAGWFSLIVALGCIPFGSMLFTLGLAKWLHHYRARRGRE